jgi:hypothetical protein
MLQQVLLLLVDDVVYWYAALPHPVVEIVPVNAQLLSREDWPGQFVVRQPFERGQARAARVALNKLQQQSDSDSVGKGETHHSEIVDAVVGVLYRPVRSLRVFSVELRVSVFVDVEDTMEQMEGLVIC